MFEAFLNSCPQSAAQTVPFLQCLVIPSESIELFSDTAGHQDLGMGFAFKNHWGFQAWEETNLFNPLVEIKETIVVKGKQKVISRWVKSEESQPNIAILELIDACATVAAWGEKLSGKRLLLHSDNTATVSMINNKKAKIPLCNFLIKQLTLFCLKFQILMSTQHVKGVDNALTDAASRRQFQRMHLTARMMSVTMDKEKMPLPAEFWPILPVLAESLKKFPATEVPIFPLANHSFQNGMRLDSKSTKIVKDQQSFVNQQEGNRPKAR